MGCAAAAAPQIEVFVQSADKNASLAASIPFKILRMVSPPLGWALVLINLVLCHLSVSLSTSSPALSTLSATIATWPITALAVVGQTFATSSLTSVPVTVMLSPILSLVQGFLAIPL